LERGPCPGGFGCDRVARTNCSSPGGVEGKLFRAGGLNWNIRFRCPRRLRRLRLHTMILSRTPRSAVFSATLSGLKPIARFAPDSTFWRLTVEPVLMRFISRAAASRYLRATLLPQ